MVVNGDLKEILSMRQDLDAYHFAFVNITGWLDGKFGEGSGRMPALLKSLASSEGVDDEIDVIYRAARDLREKYEKQSVELKDMMVEYKESLVKYEGTLKELVSLRKEYNGYREKQEGVIAEMLSEVASLTSENGELKKRCKEGKSCEQS